MAAKGLKKTTHKTPTGHSHDPAAIPCRPQTPRRPAPSRNVGSVRLAGHDVCTAERTGWNTEQCSDGRMHTVME